MRYNHHDREVLYIGPPPVNRLGKTGMWTSLLGLLSCGLLSPLGLLISSFALSRKPRGAAVAGVFLGLTGTLWLTFVGALAVGGVMSAAALEEAQLQRQTRHAMVQAEGVIARRHFETGRFPEGIEGNKLVIPFSDAWDQPLRYDLMDDDYLIRSSGPDGEFETEDDLVHHRTIPSKTHPVKVDRPCLFAPSGCSDDD